MRDGWPVMALWYLCASVSATAREGESVDMRETSTGPLRGEQNRGARWRPYVARCRKVWSAVGDLEMRQRSCWSRVGCSKAHVPARTSALMRRDGETKAKTAIRNRRERE